MEEDNARESISQCWSLSDPQGHFAESDNIQFFIIIIITKYYVFDTLMFETRVTANFNWIF